jgi:hypothetical protein
MQRQLLGMAAVALLAFSGCKKVDEAAVNATTITLDLPFDETQHPFVDKNGWPDTLLPLNTSFSIPLDDQAFATNSQAALNSKNTSADKIISAKLSKLSLTITEPANLNLNFVDSIRLYMSSSRSHSDEVLAATKIPVPRNVTTIELDLKDVEMKSFFQKDSIFMRIVPTGRAVPPKSTGLNFKANFKISGSPLK